ncbi:MAG: GIY-YIG nuclease family protein [Bacteroidales bacterium]
MYAVYILYSSKLDKYYIGSTADIAERLRRHNSHSKGFTCAGRPWILVYSECLNDKVSAEAREKQLKKWKNRARLEALIQKNFKGQSSQDNVPQEKITESKSSD